MALASLLIALSMLLPAQAPPAKAAIDVGRYHLQSNAWVNLHQRLM